MRISATNVVIFSRRYTLGFLISLYSYIAVFRFSKVYSISVLCIPTNSDTIVVYRIYTDEFSKET